MFKPVKGIKPEKFGASTSYVGLGLLDIISPMKYNLSIIFFLSFHLQSLNNHINSHGTMLTKRPVTSATTLDVHTARLMSQSVQCSHFIFECLRRKPYSTSYSMQNLIFG